MKLTASPLRFARWKRVLPLALAATALPVAATMAMAMAAPSAQAATNVPGLPSLHLMWATETAMRVGWPASPKVMSYTYELYQMNGVRVRSGKLPGVSRTVICGDLHPGWRYRAELWADSSDAGASSGDSRYATVTVTLPLPDPPRELAYQWAETQAGARYLYGGQGDGGYDCSGLVRTAYQHAGIWLPRTTGEMLGYWKLAEESAPRQGDLVFFGSGHVELYAGPEKSFGAETNSTGTWWNRWWRGDWWPTAFYRVTGAG